MWIRNAHQQKKPSQPVGHISFLYFEIIFKLLVEIWGFTVVCYLILLNLFPSRIQIDLIISLHQHICLYFTDDILDYSNDDDDSRTSNYHW